MTAWTRHWEIVERGAHIRETHSFSFSATFAFWKAQIPHLLNKLDLNKDAIRLQEAVNTIAPIPYEWFRSAMDPFNKETEKLRNSIDTRFPIIVISGLPSVGKTAIARELANLLEESDHQFVPGSKKSKTLSEAAWNFFQDRRKRPPPGRENSDPGSSGCRREPLLGPVEYFADSQAIVVDVGHLSYDRAMREKMLQGPGKINDASSTNGSAGIAPTQQPSEEDLQIASKLAWYGASMVSLDTGRGQDPNAIRCLDKGRRLAIEKFIMPEERRKSTAIFTECIFQDARNGDSKLAAAAYKTAAEVFDRRLIPIYITCSAEEHMRRFHCRERDEWQNLEKILGLETAGMLSPKVTQALQQENSNDIRKSIKAVENSGNDMLYYFSKPADFKNNKYSVPKEVDADGNLVPPTMPDSHQGCRIDTTGLTALEVAGIIQKFCEDAMYGRPGQTLENWGIKVRPERDESGEWQMVISPNGEPVD